jgi:hypothetical protein
LNRTGGVSGHPGFEGSNGAVGGAHPMVPSAGYYNGGHNANMHGGARPKVPTNGMSMVREEPACTHDPVPPTQELMRLSILRYK